MIPYIASFFSGLITLLALDAIMITYVVLPLFRRYISPIMSDNPNMIAAGLFYLSYIGLLLFLLVLPASRGELSNEALLRNAFLIGIMSYMTYELTNMTLIKGWSWQMVITDVLWGGILTLIITWVMHRIFLYFI